MPEQIIPFLTHRDLNVREHALHYLAEAHDPSPATAEDVWRCIDSCPVALLEAYRALCTMPQTDASLKRTLDALKSNPNQPLRHHLENALMRLKSGLLMRFTDLIEQAQGLSDDLRDHLKDRMEISTLPASELWDRLMQHGERFDQPPEARDPRDAFSSERIIDALSHSPEAAGWAISTLNDAAIKGFRAVYAVNVLGALRFRPAAEILLGKFASDEHGDDLMASCVDALIRIGNPKIVELVHKRFAGMSCACRLLSCDILRRIKLVQSETAAFDLLQSEPDFPIRTNLAHALCELATTHAPAIDRLVKMASSREFEPELAELDLEVAALCTMLGRLKPLRTDRSNDPSPAFRDAPSQRYAFADEADEPATVPSLPVGFEDSAPATTLRPIRRQAAKVGRNDPCPCGSGKKYKKCCGK